MADNKSHPSTNASACPVATEALAIQLATAEVHRRAADLIRGTPYSKHLDFAENMASRLCLAMTRSPRNLLVRIGQQILLGDCCKALIEGPLWHEYTKERLFREKGRPVSLDSVLDAMNSREERDQ